ncbi:unnamed protein product [Clonostachys rosea]|uniref:Uncharacterized protein n=1 Tax=Bionectria ochroleuca TaxID=29856 RepID=A0ABY6TPC8_BIOOC|nr:unnamed protein product [Clonostachys rosea]
MNTWEFSKDTPPRVCLVELIMHAFVKILRSQARVESWPVLWPEGEQNRDKGADIEAKDALGRTPLAWALITKREAVVKALVETGADITAADQDGLTPLAWASGQGAIGHILCTEKAKNA